MELLTYICCFVLPYSYNVYVIDSNHDEPSEIINYWIIHFNYMLAMSTQIGFLLFELADIKYNGIYEYFTNGWNLFDAS